MKESSPIADEAATRLAFSLMRSAYLDLAHTLRSIEDEPARELLEAIENRIAYRLGSTGVDEQAGNPEETPLVLAAGRVRAVLREARES